MKVVLCFLPLSFASSWEDELSARISDMLLADPEFVNLQHQLFDRIDALVEAGSTGEEAAATILSERLPAEIAKVVVSALASGDEVAETVLADQGAAENTVSELSVNLAAEDLSPSDQYRLALSNLPNDDTITSFSFEPGTPSVLYAQLVEAIHAATGFETLDETLDYVWAEMPLYIKSTSLASELTMKEIQEGRMSVDQALTFIWLLDVLLGNISGSE